MSFAETVPARTATWDWLNGIPSSLSSVHIEGPYVSTGYVDSDVSGVQLYVDANNGKLAPNGDNAQFNSGTIIRVPVRHAGDIVTVVSFPNQHNYTVGGSAASKDETSCEATAADVKEGYVDVVATGQSYLYSITVAQIEYETDPNTVSERTAIWDWQNGIPSSISTVHIEGPTIPNGYVDSNVTGVRLYVDASNGKLGPNGGNAQFNSGTTIRVPVRHAGDIVTVVSYPNQHKYTVGGSAASKDETSYEATAADVDEGYVDVVATDQSYLYRISVKQIAYSVEATSHTHSFSGAWTQTATHHYHACTVDGCDIDYSAVPSDLADYVKYGAHNYGSIITLAAYYTCSVCGFENETRKADADAVGAVSSLIDAIGEVEYSTSCKAKIDAARKAYDKLSEERRDLVLNYDELTAAEAMYKALTPIDVAERTAVWNWQNATLDDQIAKETQITGSIGEIHSAIAGLSLEADATATASNYFKAQMAGSVCYATLSTGSMIKVPVRRPGDKVFITCPAGQTAYTIGNVAGKNVDPKKGYTATQEDAANGYALITATKTNHFYEIKVTQKGFNAVLPKITLNSEGWASFTSLLRGYVVACPLGAKAYVATAVDDETVTLQEVTHFTYGEGVFVKGDPDSEVFANVVEAESTYPTGNNLTVGCPNDVMLYAESNAYIVATNNDNDESGFYHVKTAINVPAGKAYLYAPNTNAKSLKITFADGEEATGIESVVAGAETKAATVFYNLAGQVVGKDYKGIVVGNDGKKYVK